MVGVRERETRTASRRRPVGPGRHDGFAYGAQTPARHMSTMPIGPAGQSLATLHVGTQT